MKIKEEYIIDELSLYGELWDGTDAYYDTPAKNVVGKIKFESSTAIDYYLQKAFADYNQDFRNVTSVSYIGRKQKSTTIDKEKYVLDTEIYGTVTLLAN